MYIKSSLEEQCREILEEKGGKIADEARFILLKEESLKRLRSDLRHISKYWRDPATPSMIILSCEAVGGKPDRAVHQAALAMTLINLGINLWDDLLDKTLQKRFIPTLVGRSGEGVALIVGVLAQAKAFQILHKIDLDKKKSQALMQMVWNYLKELAEAEKVNTELKKQPDISPEEKLRVIEMQAESLKVLTNIGVLFGNGSEDESKHLGNYMKYLSMILDLIKDFKISINLTLDLAEKIKGKSLPYTILWAKGHSQELRDYLVCLNEHIKPEDIKEIVRMLLETNIIESFERLLTFLTNKAERELSNLNTNNATQTLKFILNMQAKVFHEDIESLL